MYLIFTPSNSIAPFHGHPDLRSPSCMGASTPTSTSGSTSMISLTLCVEVIICSVSVRHLTAQFSSPVMLRACESPQPAYPAFFATLVERTAAARTIRFASDSSLTLRNLSHLFIP